MLRPITIKMRGTFRFHEEFGLAVDLINRRKVDVRFYPGSKGRGDRRRIVRQAKQSDFVHMRDFNVGDHLDLKRQ